MAHINYPGLLTWTCGNKEEAIMGGDTGEPSLNQVVETSAKQLCHWHIGSFTIDTVKNRSFGCLLKNPAQPQQPGTSSSCWLPAVVGRHPIPQPACGPSGTPKLSPQVFNRTGVRTAGRPKSWRSLTDPALWEHGHFDEQSPTLERWDYQNLISYLPALRLLLWLTRDDRFRSSLCLELQSYNNVVQKGLLAEKSRQNFNKCAAI